MKSIKIVIAICSILFLFESCSSSKLTVIGFWVNKDKVVLGSKPSLFIMVLAKDLNARNIMETDLKAAAEARGLKAVTSIESLGAMNVGNNYPVDAILKKVKELKLQTIYTVALKDVRSETHYVKSSETYYNPMMGGVYGSYGSFGSYYGNYYGGGMGMGYGGMGYGGGVVMSTGSSSYTPGYTVEKKTYYLESNLYDAQTQELLLSVQTKAINPESITKASKQYTSTLISELNAETKMRK